MRYAVYFIPDPSAPIWAFGSSVIGYDSAAGSDVPFPSHNMFRHPDVRNWTEAPRTYGFHGTLKAPFALSQGKDEAALLQAAQAFAQAHRPIVLEPPVISQLGDFIALTPAAPSAELNALANACVTEFETFRAPLSPKDRERRLKTKLSSEQVSNLDRWGYPYVFDQFRFHMTLTGRLNEALRDRVAVALGQLYAPISAPLAIDAISICKQPTRDSRFIVLRRFQLKG